MLRRSVLVVACLLFAGGCAGVCGGGAAPQTTGAGGSSLTVSGAINGVMSPPIEVTCDRGSTIRLQGQIGSRPYTFEIVDLVHAGTTSYPADDGSEVTLDGGVAQHQTWNSLVPGSGGSLSAGADYRTGSFDLTLGGLRQPAGTKVRVTGRWSC
jgi:hypothetical protein